MTDPDRPFLGYGLGLAMRLLEQPDQLLKPEVEILANCGIQHDQPEGADQQQPAKQRPVQVQALHEPAEARYWRRIAGK